MCFINIVDITKLTDIEFRLCLYQISFCIVPPTPCLHLRHRGRCNDGPHQVQPCLHRSSYNLITSISSTLSILHWLPTSILHRIDIHRVSLISSLHCWNYRHIAMLIDIDSTSCLHRTLNSISCLYRTRSFLFTSSTSKCWSTSCPHVSFHLHHRHHNDGQHRVNIAIGILRILYM